MTIHTGHPFQPPEPERDPVRRFRGRAASPVSVITAGHGESRAGLTVSSFLVADGDPAAVLALIDPDSELADAVRSTGRAVVNLLSWSHHQLADAFGYVAPAPGGPFRLARWSDSDWGPVLADAPTWAGCRLAERPARTVGWALEFELLIESVHVAGGDTDPLLHQRGRYRRLG